MAEKEQNLTQGDAHTKIAAENSKWNKMEKKDALQVENKAGKSLEEQIPDYALPANKEQCYTLMKQLNFSPEMRNVFEKLCQYVTLPNINSPVVDIHKFLLYLSGRNNIKVFHRHAYLDPLYKITKLVTKEGVGLIEVLERDETDHPIKILLRERESETAQLYRYISDYFETSFRKFLDKTEALLSKKEALTTLPVSESHFNVILQSAVTDKLTLEEIKVLMKSNKPLTLFSGNKYISDVIIPTDKLPRIVETFVRFMGAYYHNDINEEIRYHIFKQVREQKLNEVRLSRVIRQGLISDSYFLFFAQLFYSIMMSIMHKMSQQNFQNKEIYNQCFIAYFLSSLSVNERNLITARKMSEQAIEDHYKAVVKGLITHFKLKRGSKTYMPVTLNEMLQFEVDATKSDKKQNILADFYNENTLNKLIQQKNLTGHDIENILVFSSSHVKYYCHRVRLVDILICMLETERGMIEIAILQDWKENTSKIINKDKEDDFIELLEEKYISAFFKNYINLMIKVILMSRVGGGKMDYSYLVKRLFLLEEEKLMMNLAVTDLLYKAADLDKKKRVLEQFYEMLINPQTNTPLQTHEILNISFPVIRRLAIENSEMVFFKKITFMIKEFFSGIVLFFEGNKNYLRFLARRYYKLPSSARRQLGNKAALSSPGKRMPFTHKPPEDAPSEIPQTTTKPLNAPPTGRIAVQRQIDTLLRHVPDLKNISTIEANIEKNHELWNIKMGASRNDIRAVVDAKINSLMQRFDVDAFSEANMDMLYTKAVANAQIEPIGDKEALKRYIFYKSALLRYKKLKQQQTKNK